MTQEMARDIRRYKYQHPDASPVDIAEWAHTSPRNVLSALASNDPEGICKAIKEYWHQHPEMDWEELAQLFGYPEVLIWGYVSKGYITRPTAHNQIAPALEPSDEGAKHARMTRERREARYREITQYWAEHPTLMANAVAAQFGLDKSAVTHMVLEGRVIAPPDYKNRHGARRIDWAKVSEYWQSHPELKPKEIASVFGCGHSSVKWAVHEGKCKRPDKPAPTQTEEQTIREEQTMMTATKPDTIHTAEAHAETAAITPTKERTCTHCSATLVPGARYCHICGTQYIDPRELCIRALEKLAQNISTFYPRTARDNAIAQITMIREYIESTCEEV